MILTKEAPSETLLRRREILAELAAMQMETQKLDDNAKQQRQRVRDAEAALEAAKLELVQANKRATSRAVQAGYRENPLKIELLETAPAEIIAAIEKLEAEIEDFAKQQRTEKRDRAPVELVVRSNHLAIERHRAECRAAIAKLRELQTLAVSDREVAREIKAAVASVTVPSLALVERGGKQLGILARMFS